MISEIKTTSSGKDYLPNATKLITRCFWDDPAIRYMLSSMSDEGRKAYYPAYMHSLLKAAALNDGDFVEANDWSCCALWVPPGKRVDNVFTMIPAGLLTCLMRLGFGGLKRMLGEFQSQTNNYKKQALRDANGNKITKYHYLFFIATAPEARGHGYATELIKRKQLQASQDGMPIWLEGTTKHSRNIYARSGFEEVGKIEMGKGTHSASGVPEKGGEGVTLYAMIWRPEDHKV